MSFLNLTNPNNGVATNPTSLYVPVNVDGVFADSDIYDSKGFRTTIDDQQSDYRIGLVVDYIEGTARLGRTDSSGNKTALTVDESAGQIFLEGLNIQSNSSSGASGRFLNIFVNGFAYKLQLLAP
jgi:hypothetical protein